MNSELLFAIIILVLQTTPQFKCESRSKRHLLFPRANPARAQFIAGVGLPVDLELESVTVGYVFKALYILPYNASDWRPDYPHFPLSYYNRKVQRSVPTEQFIVNHEDPTEEFPQEDLLWGKHNPKHSRWTFYKGIEQLVENNNMMGRPCMLRGICEASQAPFSHSNGILGELMHIIMSPSSSLDDIEHYTDNEYLRAEEMGRMGEPCEQVFKECPQSILEIFSGIYDPLRGHLENVIKSRSIYK